MRDLQQPGRSPVYAPRAMASTSHPLATSAALDILRQGGNAVDAAIAAVAVHCVVEPAMTSVGGDCFCLYSPNGSAKPVALNGSGRAPLGLSDEWRLAQGIDKIEQQTRSWGSFTKMLYYLIHYRLNRYQAMHWKLSYHPHRFQCHHPPQ